MAENKRHKGHRQRMRERVQSYGLDSLAEHEALEYVLYLTNAQKDTNGIAHDLIDRFGDFAAVLCIMNLRVTISGKVKFHEERNRSESEPEEGVKSEGVDAKPSDLHLSRLKSR